MTLEQEIISKVIAKFCQNNGDIKKATKACTPLLQRYASVTTTLKNSKEVDSLVAQTSIRFFDHILSVVAHQWGVTTEDIISKSRKRELVVPRHICIYIAVVDYNMSPSMVTRKLGRHWSTSSYAVSQCENTHFEYDSNHADYELCKELLSIRYKAFRKIKEQPDA